MADFRQKYPDDFKQKVIAYVRDHTYKETRLDYGVSESTIAKWALQAGIRKKKGRAVKSTKYEKSFLTREERDYIADTLYARLKTDNEQQYKLHASIIKKLHL